MSAIVLAAIKEIIKRKVYRERIRQIISDSFKFGPMRKNRLKRDTVHQRVAAALGINAGNKLCVDIRQIIKTLGVRPMRSQGRFYYDGIAEKDE